MILIKHLLKDHDNHTFLYLHRTKYHKVTLLKNHTLKGRNRELTKRPPAFHTKALRYMTVGTTFPHHNKADRHKSRAPRKQQATNQQTDGLTNKAAYRVACTRLKTEKAINFSAEFCTPGYR